MKRSHKTLPRWIRPVLIVAGVYNLVWGIACILFPHLLFDWVGIERLNHPEIWQCVGMIVGVYGVGYLIAADNSRRHWPIVLVGLLGKIFGPVGFAVAVWKSDLPIAFGATIVTNDLIWWLPFAFILKDAFAVGQCEGDHVCIDNQRFIKETRLAATQEAVFRFHENDGALKMLIPPWENMKPIESAGSLQPGSRVVLAGKVGILPVRWIAVHTEYQFPEMFADRQESGPFAFWYHRHYCLRDGNGGTVLRDEVEYRLPMGWFGQFFGGWLVRRKLDRMFQYRHDITKRAVESV